MQIFIMPGSYHAPMASPNSGGEPRASWSDGPTAPPAVSTGNAPSHPHDAYPTRAVPAHRPRSVRLEGAALRAHAVPCPLARNASSARAQGLVVDQHGPHV